MVEGKQVRRACFLAGAFVLAPLLASGQTVEYAHLDALGSVRAVTDRNGAVIERHDYLPFGEECLSGPCATNPNAGAGQPRKFTGKERDTETGLDYFGARYYQAKWGRFTTTDPIYTWRESLIDPQRWNRYAYGRNNPFRYVDPDGREIRLAENASDTLKVGYQSARAYLGVSGADLVLRELDARKEVVTIVETKGLSETDVRFAPQTNTIYWNPHAGLRTREGGTQSPALGLSHEADHALQKLKNPSQFERDLEQDGSEFDTPEERRVILGSETTAARLKGEDARTSHRGSFEAVRFADDRPPRRMPE